MQSTRRQFLAAAGSAVVGTSLFPQAILLAEESSAGMTVCQLTNQTHSQMMSYIVKTASGELLVVDGGCAGDANHLLEMLEKLHGQSNPKIAGWFLSHCHGDHVLALCELIQSGRLPKVEKIYYHFPTAEWLLASEPGSTRTINIFHEQISSVQERVVQTVQGQKFQYGNLTVTVLNDPHLDPKRNPINNSNVCFRFETPQFSLLFLGDLGQEGSQKLLEIQPTAMLRADAVQMAHHGQSGATRELYATIAPKICFWPTPTWLWNNDRGKGPDSGPWTIRKEQRWMQELGVETHYIGKDGTQTVEFS
ncbi:MAG: MBL fold metallo-hydrolase [Planctomycetia bacterium]|nr:MBL fold metallo-hydrolase [Planctomycetia bacterium]